MSCKYCGKLVFVGYFRQGSCCASCNTHVHFSCVPGGLLLEKEEPVNWSSWQCDRCSDEAAVKKISKRIDRLLAQFPDSTELSELNPFKLNILKRKICQNLTALQKRSDASVDHHDRKFDEIHRGVKDVSEELEDIEKELDAVRSRVGGRSWKFEGGERETVDFSGSSSMNPEELS